MFGTVMMCLIMGRPLPLAYVLCLPHSELAKPRWKQDHTDSKPSQSGPDLTECVGVCMCVCLVWCVCVCVCVCVCLKESG